MKVLVTGATGFTGSHVVRGFLARGIEVVCFVRPSSALDTLPAGGFGIVRGDLGEPDSLRDALSGADALVNVASLGFGHAPGIVRAAKQAGVERGLFISTTAVFTELQPASKAVRLAAEDEIRNSGMVWTILRPTMIYGSARDRNMCRLIRYLSRWPIIPLPGRRKALQQPVYVEDVADSVLQALESPAALCKAYSIAGGTVLTFEEIVDTICGLLGRSVLKIPLPTGAMIRTVHNLEKCGFRLPIKTEQILRLSEDKAFGFSDAERDFGYRPRSFREGILLELRALGLA